MRECGAALVHDARCLRSVPAGSERAHEQAVSGLTERVARDKHPRSALGLGWPLLIDLGLHDGLERLQLDVAEGSPLGFDPVAVLTRKESPRRDLVRNDRLGPRGSGVTSPADRLDMLDRAPSALAVDEGIGRQHECVTTRRRSQLSAFVGVKTRKHGPQPADERVDARVGGVRLLVAPERAGDFPSTDRPPTIQHQVRPELSAKASRQRGFLDHESV